MMQSTIPHVSSIYIFQRHFDSSINLVASVAGTDSSRGYHVSVNNLADLLWANLEKKIDAKLEMFAALMREPRSSVSTQATLPFLQVTPPTPQFPRQASATAAPGSVLSPMSTFIANNNNIDIDMKSDAAPETPTTKSDVMIMPSANSHLLPSGSTLIPPRVEPASMQSVVGHTNITPPDPSAAGPKYPNLNMSAEELEKARLLHQRHHAESPSLGLVARDPNFPHQTKALPSTPTGNGRNADELVTRGEGQMDAD